MNLSGTKFIIILIPSLLNSGHLSHATEISMITPRIHGQTKNQANGHFMVSASDCFFMSPKVTNPNPSISTFNSLQLELIILKTSDAIEIFGIRLSSLFNLFLLILLGNNLMKMRKLVEKISSESRKSEQLLLNILPKEVAEELKANGKSEAKMFNQVTVLFTDFKDFTQISERMTPNELVNELNTFFKAFDDIITRLNIEKIKTIGDSYMCVGGLPKASPSHADDVVNAGLDIQDFVEKYSEVRLAQGKEPLLIRIGIHSGPVIAGIVGIKKYAYDIWGDTVNTASRMESSGEAGKVNISETTYELVKDKFRCTPRGKIVAKHKGEMEMYFVESRL
jgi:adenylate cyclase